MRQDMGIGRRSFLRRAVSMAALTVAPVCGKVMASAGGVSLKGDSVNEAGGIRLAARRSAARGRYPASRAWPGPG